MATTVGTTFPIRPAGGYGSAKASDLFVLPCDPSVSFTDGDIIYIDGTTKDAQVASGGATVQGTTFVFGVAQMQSGQSATSAATIDRDEPVGIQLAPGGTGTPSTINVALAFPGARFTGNIINGTSDETGVYADNLRVKFGTLDSADAFACIDMAETTDLSVYAMKYVSPQFDKVNDTWIKGREAGVGILNPRVEFIWLIEQTVFGENVDNT